MSTTETREHNCYTRQDKLADAAFVIVLICAACGILDLVGSF